MEVIYSKACGVDVHKSFIVAVICDSTGDKPIYTKNAFPHLTTTLYNLESGLSQTTVKMYAWNLLESITFLFTMH